MTRVCLVALVRFVGELQTFSSFSRFSIFHFALRRRSISNNLCSLVLRLLCVLKKGPQKFFPWRIVSLLCSGHSEQIQSTPVDTREH